MSKSTASNAPVDLDPCHGTRDFFPDDMRLQRWLYDKFHTAAARFGFQEFDAPVLEKQELYTRKAGEEIADQMYQFKDPDKPDQPDKMVTLRPEMTPSLARMVLQLQRRHGERSGDIAAILPLKWYSIPQCWRFETTQRGRKREHYQWNMDIVGEAKITAEVELLAAMVYFFESIGLSAEDIGFKVNSRKVLNAVLASAGISHDVFPKVCVIIDKQDKIGAEECRKELISTLKLSEEVARKVLSATCAKSLEEFAKISNCENSPEVEELQELFQLAKDYGISDWLQFDASVVRGLAYYTGVVFEGFDRGGVLRAVCGGGRYDRLLSLYGSKDEIPCCGFGFGDCVIVELLKEKNKLPSLARTVDYIVAPFNKDYLGKSMDIASIIRKSGKNVDMLFKAEKKIKKVFEHADRVGARRIVFVAPDELAKGVVCVKDLRVEDESQKQKEIPLDQLHRIDDYFAESSIPSPPSGSIEEMDAFLALNPYIAGYTPGRADAEFYRENTTVDFTKFANVLRWRSHMSSFTQSQRDEWP